MTDKLKEIEIKYESIQAQLADPSVYANPGRMTALMREQKALMPIVEIYREWQKAKKSASDAEGMMSDADPELRELAREEYKASISGIARLEDELQVLLLPVDPDDDKNVIMEIRGGVGGDEAALFAAALWRMYSMYAERKRWKTDILSISETELGGIKELSVQIEGQGAYSRLKFESGAHRVQRVPDTETQGRVHTSAATVAVLPEAQEVDVEISADDLDISTCRAGGAGGQHVNKTESAIRIVHKPSGITVECQDERSQHKNKDKAMKILRARIYEMRLREMNEARDSERRNQVGSGDRSERIRTYNFPQGRLTDHRIGLTLYKLQGMMDGDIDEVIDALHRADTAEKLGNNAGDERKNPLRP
ncbi:MAG: peptide chain release factor 1 [Oscillospiraceae bacterium]|nr:peptide chain release factor 1 [Oscillospiraceae bacterium]